MVTRSRQVWQALQAALGTVGNTADAIAVRATAAGAKQQLERMLLLLRLLVLRQTLLLLSLLLLLLRLPLIVLRRRQLNRAGWRAVKLFLILHILCDWHHGLLEACQLLLLLRLRLLLPPLLVLLLPLLLLVLKLLHHLPIATVQVLLALLDRIWQQKLLGCHPASSRFC